MRFCFLICSERSGSNFITSLMNGHPLISGPPPSHLFRLFATNRGNYGDLEDDRNWHLLIDDVVENWGSQLGRWMTEPTAEGLASRARCRSVAEVLRQIYEREAAHDGAEVIFVKENRTATFAHFLLANFPDCSFVWMTRDPRDVAGSWVITPSIPGGVEKAVGEWIRDQRMAMDLYQQIRDTGRIIKTRYEDLIGDPDVVLGQLTSFLNVEYSAGMLDFHLDGRTRINAGRIEAWANLARPILRDNAGRYRERLSPADVEFVELSCDDLMRQLGYASEQVDRPIAAATREARLERLRREITQGSLKINDPAEREIRQRRMVAVQKVLDRRLDE